MKKSIQKQINTKILNCNNNLGATGSEKDFWKRKLQHTLIAFRVILLKLQCKWCIQMY